MAMGRGMQIMWRYEKRLQYPVNISQPNPQMAQFIMSQYGGPDCENRYRATTVFHTDSHIVMKFKPVFLPVVDDFFQHPPEGGTFSLIADSRIGNQFEGGVDVCHDIRFL